MYCFDEVINRKGTNCTKWDRYPNNDVIPLWIADMDFPCISQVQQAIVKRAQHPIYGYTNIDDKVYQDIISWQKNQHNVDVKKEEIVLTTGVVYALYLAISLFVKKDEKVIIQPPVYPPFSGVPTTLDREIVFNNLKRVGNDWQMDLIDFEDKLKSDSKIKMFILCNPHNPTGKCYSKEDIRKVSELCHKYNVILISDEIHNDIIMPGSKHNSIYTCIDDISDVVMFSSVTKTFNLAGMKVAYAIIKDEKIREIYKKQASASGLSSINLFALEALKAVYENGQEWSKQCNQYIYDNFLFLKEYLDKYIPQIGFVIPQATYLAWLDFSKLNIEGDINQRLKNEAKVELNSGSGFSKQCCQFQRMNVACPRSTLKIGLDRIRDWLKENKYI